MEVRKKILITDASYKHTLGAIRSLGKAGFYVIAMAPNKRAQSFFSRYCHEKVICPDPRSEDQFIQFLTQYLSKNHIDVLLPVGYLTTVIISKHKQELLPFVKIPIADFESIQVASNKEKTMQLADSLDISIPKEYDSIENIVSFPIVVKGLFESGQIQYINSFGEFQQIKFKQYLTQEYIPGEGFGFYALFNQGSVKAFFMHKRLREYPITGGASTCARSIYNEELKELGLKLLQSLHWHGVAMVEFKKDSRDGKFKLMEINPKFWGSLDLSIAAGVDFPKLIVDMALHDDVETVFHYNQNIKFRWPFPDDILQLCANPRSIKDIFAECFDKNTKSNVWVSDSLPNIIQIYTTFFTVVFRILCGNLRYPHGNPKENK